MEVSTDRTLAELRRATKSTEYEGRLFLVGGFVRDKAMGREAASSDIDIVLEGDALALARFLHERGATTYAPVVYPRFGTAMVVIAGHDVELVTARVESYAENSRKPDEVLPGTIDQDARRRDFTINTLLENLHTAELLDPTGCGLDDIRRQIIRTPTEPQRTFIDDPLRMLRAIRFATRLGFAIDPATWNAIRESAGRLSIISRERIRDEFNKIMLTPRAAEGLELLRQSGLLAEFVPELLETVGVTQNEFHALPVWEHTLQAVRSVPPDASLVVRLAVLFHDIGKPRTRSVDPEDHRVHFYRHEDIGAEMAREILNRLKYSNDEINTASLLVAEHMRIGEYKPAWTDAAVRRLIRDLGRHLDDLFVIHAADVAALAPGYQEMSRAVGLRARIREIESQQDILSLTSPLDGNAIMKLLGLAPGPDVKEAKDFLTRAVVDGSLGPDDRAGAEALLRRNFGDNNNS